MTFNASPSIACIGVLGKHDNPLHLSHFPPHDDESARQEMTYLLYTCIDIFEIRKAEKRVDPDLGLLQAVNERIATYGYVTNTGIKFVVVVDMSGRPPPANEPAPRQIPPPVGLRDSDLKPAFRAIHNAYVRLMLNPFYTPDEKTPLQQANFGGKPAEITSKRFAAEMQRIGKAWVPG